MTVVALVGHRGFIGGAIAQAAGAGIDLVPIDLRVCGAWRPGVAPAEAAGKWLEDNGAVAENLSGQFHGAGVVINAAGLAAPASRMVADLFDANAVLPAVIAMLAARAGVPRMVQVSSAAVQPGRVLDETTTVRPDSPYSRSKAAGEQVLLDAAHIPAEVVIYRPTSVQAAGRTVTRRLVNIASRRFVPVAGDGRSPVPVCLAPNVAAGILHAATSPECLGVVLQPWEGVTTRRLWELFTQGSPHFVYLPAGALRAALAATRILKGASPELMAAAKRAGVLLLGQEQRAHALEVSGFKAPAGIEHYRLLAQQVRSR